MQKSLSAFFAGIGKAVLPLALGAIGAWFAISFPNEVRAFCGFPIMTIEVPK